MGHYKTPVSKSFLHLDFDLLGHYYITINYQIGWSAGYNARSLLFEQVKVIEKILEKATSILHPWSKCWAEQKTKFWKKKKKQGRGFWPMVQ